MTNLQYMKTAIILRFKAVHGSLYVRMLLKNIAGQIPLRLGTGDGAGSVYTLPTEPGPFAKQHEIL